jgi:DNA repair protein RadC
MSALGLKVQGGNIAVLPHREDATVLDSGSTQMGFEPISDLLMRFSGVDLYTEDDPTPATLLAHILGLVYPLQASELLARQLLSVFGSLGASLSARVEHLQSNITNGFEVSIVLRAVHRLFIGALREKIKEGTHLRNIVDLTNYLRMTLSHEKSEQVRLLHLSPTNELIRDELHSVGTINHLAIYPREIVKRALDVSASALIIVHNHPSGDPTPSPEDVDMTRHLRRVLKAVDVELHDHVIVGKAECFSFKAEGFLHETRS